MGEVRGEGSAGCRMRGVGGARFDGFQECECEEGVLGEGSERCEWGEERGDG